MSLAYVKSLKTGKKYAIETSLLFDYIDGRKGNSFDPTKFTSASNDYCTLDEDGTSTIRHAVYACGDSKAELKEKMLKVTDDGKVLRGVVVPARKSIGPVTAPITTQHKDLTKLASETNAELEAEREKVRAASNARVLKCGKPEGQKRKQDELPGTSKSCRKVKQRKKVQKKPKPSQTESDSSDDEGSKQVVNTTMPTIALPEEEFQSDTVGAGTPARVNKDAAGAFTHDAIDTIHLEMKAVDDAVSPEKDSDIMQEKKAVHDAVCDIPVNIEIKKKKAAPAALGIDPLKVPEVSLDQSPEENLVTLFHYLTVALSRLQTLEKHVKNLHLKQEENHALVMGAITKLAKSVTTIRNNVDAPKCKLSDLERAIEGHEQINVPCGKVLVDVIGTDPIFLQKTDILKRVEKASGMSSRCLALAKLFWPGDWKERTLDGKLDKAKIITHAHSAAMTVILKSLHWTTPVEFDGVRRTVGKAISDARKKAPKQQTNQTVEKGGAEDEEGEVEGSKEEVKGEEINGGLEKNVDLNDSAYDLTFLDVLDS